MIPIPLRTRRQRPPLLKIGTLLHSPPSPARRQRRLPLTSPTAASFKSPTFVSSIHLIPVSIGFSRLLSLLSPPENRPPLLKIGTLLHSSPSPARRQRRLPVTSPTAASFKSPLSFPRFL
ncbi:hypothetical protein L2E82_00239 [Cichorium intybus]|uniref:Uncharacterized protein n=1 Tax=Cichorium intybus TaxID=13427 RepID=A0ACB9GXK4_CICIN|nr:hypothetical protein L2E82_00239 [Cichorium intybus]